MKKLLLLLVLLLAVLVTVVSDLYRRSREGFPDPLLTGIQTLRCPAGVRVGLATVSIAPDLGNDARLGSTGLPEERSIDFFLDLIEPPADSARPEKRKNVNGLFIKCLVFSAEKRPQAVIFSADLPVVSREHLDSLESSLKKRYSLDRRFVTVLTPGLFNTFSVSPSRFAESACRALEQALKEPSAAEWAFVSPKKLYRPSNINGVELPGAGLCRVPPLCGPIVDNRAYDATDLANAWLSTLSENPEKPPPLSLKTRPCSLSVYSMLIFRSPGSPQLLGGIVLSGVIPCIVPPAKSRGDMSSDYVFHLCDHLERKLGGTFLFARAPGAELIPFIDAFSHPNAHRFGISLGAALAQEIKTAAWEKLEKTLFYFRDRLDLPFKDGAGLPDSALAALCEKYRAQSRSLRGLDLDLPTKREIQDRYLSYHYLRTHFSRFGRPAEPGLKALRLNRFIFICLPGEHFLASSIALQNRLPGTRLCIADHADETLSFVVPEAEYRGGFAPNRSLFKPAAWAMIMEKTENLVGAAGLKEKAAGRP